MKMNTVVAKNIQKLQSRKQKGESVGLPTEVRSKKPGNRTTILLSFVNIMVGTKTTIRSVVTRSKTKRRRRRNRNKVQVNER